MTGSPFYYLAFLLEGVGLASSAANDDTQLLSIQASHIFYFTKYKQPVLQTVAFSMSERKFLTSLVLSHYSVDISLSHTRCLAYLLHIVRPVSV